MAMSVEVGLVILAIVIGLQLVPRPLRGDYRAPAILAAIGLYEAYSYLRDHHGGSLVVALAGSLVLAAVSGAVRVPSVRLWVQDGQIWRRGTWLTAVLWIASLAAHFGYDALVTHGNADAGVAGATIVLYFAVSQAVQRVLLSARAARHQAGAARTTPGLRWGSSAGLRQGGAGR
jgi:hypothetical protein